VRIVDAPKFISSVPQSGQNATRQSPLPERLTFLCRLFEFIDFTIQMSGRIKSAEAVVHSVDTALDTCSARLLTLAGYQYSNVLDGWLFILLVALYCRHAQSSLSEGERTAVEKKVCRQ
jgi:hypothetical protein